MAAVERDTIGGGRLRVTGRQPGRARWVPIAPEGRAFVLPPLVLAVALASVGWVGVAFLAGGVAAIMAFFFRDPERTPPAVAGAVLAPADGRVVEVREDVDDPVIGPARQVSIFLSPLDVHVNRAPIAGSVLSVEHQRGAFAPAYRPGASERNTRTVVVIQGDAARIVVRQVAGILARRIVCRVGPGDRLAAGERFGLIRFGSRTDVVMPAAVRLAVRSGDRVRAGETIVAVCP